MKVTLLSIGFLFLSMGAFTQIMQDRSELDPRYGNEKRATFETSNSFDGISKVHKNLLPNSKTQGFRDGFCGYGWNADMGQSLVPTGPVRINLPEGSVSLIKHVPSSTIWMNGGDFVRDTWYATSYQGTNSGLYTIDPSTGDYTLVGYTGYKLTGLAYDHFADVLYASGYDGTISSLYTINRTTGAATLVGKICDGVIISIAVDWEGTIYGLRIDDASLYTINNTTGVGTKIGYIGFGIAYAQDLAYDRDHNILYGSLFPGMGALCQIDVKTGVASYVYIYGAEICAVGIPYAYAENGAPQKVSDLLINAASMGVLEATLEWTNPTSSFNGQALTELSSVIIERNDVVIATISNPVMGQQATFTDNIVPKAGFYKYTVYGTNSSGNGMKTEYTQLVGEDVPGAPLNVTLQPQGSDGLITWDAPKDGFNGGYLSGNGITYSLMRLPDSVTIVQGISTTEYTDKSIPGIGNYYYAVTASNSFGNGGTASSNISLLQAGNFIMYETFNYPVEMLPPGWQLIGVKHPWTVYSSSEAAGTSPELRLNWIPAFKGTSRLISYPIKVAQGSTLNMKYKYAINDYSNNTDEMASIEITFNKGITWKSVWQHEIKDNVKPTIQNLYFDVPLDADSMHIAFRFTGDNFNINNWVIDDIEISQTRANDLACLSMVGSKNPTIGEASIYAIEIQNAGKNTQTNYAVKLMQEGGKELAAIAGNEITSGEKMTYQLTWIPQKGEPENTTIYAVIESSVDEVQENNQSAFMSIVILPEGTHFIAIGDGNSNEIWPFNFTAHHSLSQTIYYASEIAMAEGIITKISFKSDFYDVITDKKIQIWLGETQKTDLTEGWILPDNLQLVFDGIANFENGINDILFSFNANYYYQGGNLVVYIHKQDNSSFFGNYFSNTKEPSATRTRNAMSSSDPFDPTNPYDEGSLSEYYPNIQFVMVETHAGRLQGLVSSEVDKLSEVSVKLTGTSLTASTLINGEYSFKNVLPGFYDVEFAKFGFEDLIHHDVKIAADSITILNVEMASIPLYQVTGTVIGNDGNYIAGAKADLQGYTNYSVLTDENGMFNFESVFRGNYSFSLKSEGYDEVENIGLSINQDTTLNVLLIENIAAPFGLNVETENQQQGNALLSWNKVADGFNDSFEDGTFNAWNEFIQGSGVSSEPEGFSYWHTTNKPDGGIAADGDFVAKVDWGYNINTWLITPQLVAQQNDAISFSWYSQYYWSVYPHANAQLMVKVSTDKGETWTELWNWQKIGEWSDFTWNQTTIDLSDYANRVIQIAFHLVADNNAVTQIDDISIGTGMKPGTKILSKPITVDTHAKSLPKSLLVEKIVEGYHVFLNGEEVAQQISDKEFLFQGLAEGNYTAGVQTIQTTGSSDTSMVNFNIEYKVPLSITVTTNDGLSAEGATVSLTNLDYSQFNYEGSIDNNNQISFPLVKKGNYKLEIFLDKYHPHIQTDLKIQDTTSISIQLVEIIEKPYSLVIETEGLESGQALFSWSNFVEKDFRWDNGTLTAQFGSYNGTLDMIFGSVHRNKAILYEMTWYLSSLYATHTTVKVWVFGLDSYGNPDVDNILYEMENVPNTDDQWNNHAFSQPIDAPNGFLIGISADGYLGIGSDNGTDPQWPFQTNTHYFVENRNTDNFYAIENFGDYSNNLMIRAYGQDWGVIPFNSPKQTPSKATTGLAYLQNPTIIQPIAPSYNSTSITNLKKSFMNYQVFLDNLENPYAVIGNNNQFLFNGLSEGMHLAGVQSIYSTGTSEIATIEFEIAKTKLFPVTFQVMDEAGKYQALQIKGEFSDPKWVNQSMIKGVENSWSQTIQIVPGTYQWGIAEADGSENGLWLLPSGVNLLFTLNQDGSIEGDTSYTILPNVIVEKKDTPISIFPNPATEEVTIQSKVSIQTIEIYDFTGRKMLSRYVNDTKVKIPVNSFDNGSYLVWIYTNDRFYVKTLHVQQK